MSRHELAYTLAYTSMTRRDNGSGSLFQRCEARYGCPPLEVVGEDADGKPIRLRPKHVCKGRWFGMVDAGSTKNGDRRRVTVSGATKGVVQRRLRDKVLEIERLGTTAATTKAKTVSQYATEWLEAIETKVSPSALTTDKAAVKKINAAIGSTRLRDLTAGDVRSVAKKIRDGGGSSSTSLRYHGSLMRMLKAATLDGHPISPNVLLAEKPTAAINDKQALERHHYKAALAELVATKPDGSPKYPDASRWAVAFLTGMRQKEALGLTWEYVDLEAGTITVAWQTKSLKYVERGNPAAGFVVPDGYEARHLVGAVHLVRPKSKKGWRVVPLVPWAAAALRSWKAVAPENTHGLVWPGPHRRKEWWPRNEAADREQWHAIQAAAGIAHPAKRPYGTHEIRHTTATILLELKVDESIRKAIMGHASIEATQIYETVDRGMALDALSRVGDRLGLPAPT